MGYKSDVVIAVSADVILEASLDNSLPKLLTANYCTSWVSYNVHYFSFEDIKWYETYPDIDECMVWLSSIEDIEINHTTPDGQLTSHLEERYGFLRIGEENMDIEELGNPSGFEIYINRTIDAPGMAEA